MTTLIRFLLLLTVAAALTGCASTMEDVNEGAKSVGRPVGGVMRVPNSVSEGVAEGVAGQPKSNPYKR